MNFKITRKRYTSDIVFISISELRIGSIREVAAIRAAPIRTAILIGAAGTATTITTISTNVNNKQ